MLGLNWVDVAIFCLLALAIYYGLRIGLLRLLFLLGGFFGALFFGGWLFPHLLPLDDKTLLAVINGNLVLIFAIYIAFKGYDIGRRLHVKLGLGKLRLAESAAGVIISAGSVLLAVWLIAAAIGSLPFAGLSNSVNDALLVQQLDHHLPAVPAVFASFNHAIDPNSPPRLAVKDRPDLPVDNTVLTPSPAVIKASESVVRITSFGCGGLVNGSGFIVGPDLIATNSHVIAGVKRPIVKFGSRSYEGVPVLFDSNQDFAVLRVAGLKGRPLTLTTSETGVGSKLYVIGYPDSNYAVATGIIRNSFTMFGTSIYGVGTVNRNVYEIQANVSQGNSGGPAVLPDGRVAGIMFARSTLTDGYGYAITSPSLTSDIQQALKSFRRVSTGVCFRD